MQTKRVQFSCDLKKISTKSPYPNMYSFILKIPSKIKIKNVESQNISQVYVNIKYQSTPPGALLTKIIITIDYIGLSLFFLC